MPLLSAVHKVLRPKLALSKTGMREHIAYARVSGKPRRIYTNAVGEKLVVKREPPEKSLTGRIYNVSIEPVDAGKTPVGAWGSILANPKQNEVYIQRVDTLIAPSAPCSAKGRRFIGVMLDEAKQIALKEFGKTGCVITIGPINEELTKYYESFGFKRKYKNDLAKMFIAVEPKK